MCQQGNRSRDSWTYGNSRCWSTQLASKYSGREKSWREKRREERARFSLFFLLGAWEQPTSLSFRFSLVSSSRPRFFLNQNPTSLSYFPPPPRLVEEKRKKIPLQGVSIFFLLGKEKEDHASLSCSFSLFSWSRPRFSLNEDPAFLSYFFPPPRPVEEKRRTTLLLPLFSSGRRERRPRLSLSFRLVFLLRDPASLSTGGRERSWYSKTRQWQETK